MSRLRVESFGSAGNPDLALVHGWGIGKKAWSSVSEILARSFRVHLVSLPGYDEEEASASCSLKANETAISGLASFNSTVDELYQALPAGCAVCGWSLGSMLAMHAAIRAPGHFSNLTLVGATPRFTQADTWPHAEAPTLLDAFDSAVAADPTTALQRFAALLNQGDTQARACTRSLTKNMTPPDSATLTQGLGWLRDVDLRDTVAALTLPVLLIHGEHDPLMPLPAAQWLNASIAGSTLEVFAGAAHAPFLNDPERFAALLTHAVLH